MLNPALKEHLETLFGAVTVHAEDDPAETRLTRVRGVNVFLPSKGEYYSITCPFCGKEDKLWVNHTFGTTMHFDGVGLVPCAKKVFHCFTCEFDKKDPQSTSTFIKALEGGGFNGVVLKPPEKPVERKQTVFPYTVEVTGAVTVAADYLMSRGLDPVRVEREWSATLSNDRRFFGSPYIVFPIYRHNELTTWQARRIYDDEGPKYYFDPAGRKTEFLYNMDRARHSRIGVLVEGIFDCVSVGWRHAVATFGKVPSTRQLALLKSMYSDGTLIVLYDRDFVADAIQMVASWRNAGYFKNLHVVELPDDRDPGDYGEDEIWKIISNQTGVII
jgi:hypothetical protein